MVEEIKTKEISKSQFNDISSKLINNPNSINVICETILNIDYKNKSVIDEIAKVINLDFDEFLETKQPYLTSLQIDSLIKQGFSVGAHSIDHPEYFNITYDEQIKQTTESLQWIKNNFKQKYNLFALCRYKR
jgi:peptidoglycan/xylan/chitin deacetylase (PgdA/CDA1 family)